MLSAALLLTKGSCQSQPPIAGQDLVKLSNELHTLLDRTAGQPLGSEQAQALTQFLERHAGTDLGPYGYAKALVHYFRREAQPGASLLEEHFARFATIEHEEHAAMAGRMYLLALREQAALPREQRLDAAARQGWCERAAMLAPDLEILGGVAPGLLRETTEEVGMRLAMVRGVLRNRADAAAKDRFLARLYAPPILEERDTVRPGADPTAPTPIRPAVASSAERRTLAVGQPAPELPIESVLHGDAEFNLTKLRGKVVVLDFYATWCPPCRTGTPELQKLVEETGAGAVLVGVTRLHGRGMDFSAGAKPPHGGKLVASLDRDAEVALNQRFAAVFGIKHALVLTTEAAMQDYGIELLPTAVVLDRDGKFLGRVQGSGAESLRQLRALLSKQ
jgi:thiol-disulfide isomerase/thioredoxin